MKKRNLILLVLFLIPMITLSAQNNDELTLKNGSVIRGEIVEIVPDGNVTINDAAGNTWVYPMSEIDHINQVKNKAGMPGDTFPPGWANITSIGFLAGSPNSSQVAPFSLTTSFGYKNALGMYTGLGTGIEFLNINHIPVFMDIQYFLRNREVSPVLILRGGYAIPSKGESEDYGNIYSYKGGVTGSIGIGLKIRSKENIAWDIGFMYRYMQITYSEQYNWNDQNNTYTDIYNRLELRLGFYLN
jgi:hypothetical protein